MVSFFAKGVGGTGIIPFGAYRFFIMTLLIVLWPSRWPLDAFIIAISSIAVNRSSTVYDRFYFSDKFIISVLEESAIDRLLLLDVLHAIMRYLQVNKYAFFVAFVNKSWCNCIYEEDSLAKF